MKEERFKKSLASSFFLLNAVVLFSFFFFQCSTSDLLLPRSPLTILAGGRWDLLQPSVGISAMHMQLLHNNKVVIFDRTDYGPSNLLLPSNLCQNATVFDCSAHSLLYDVASNTYRPLSLRYDTWCSSGSLNSSGSLIQTGGYGAGEKAVRIFTPCEGVSCDWVEKRAYLSSRRWYSTNQILPDGRIIIVGGRRAFTYEFYPKIPGKSVFNLRFLAETRDLREENNLYPFLHLLPDGNLFIFANRRSILFDFVNHRIVKEFPEIPGGDKRNYPSTGSSVLLPIFLTGETNRSKIAAEILVCGGAPPGAFVKAARTIPKIFVEASRTCGRLKVTDPNPKWVMEHMPSPRVMPDMLLLPNGDVLIINGAANGTAGWEDATNANLNPILYLPNEPDPTRRFEILAPTLIPRMYHSASLLLSDGRVLVGGSNPHRNYNFTARPYPTELSLEAYLPRYLDPEYAGVRPSILTVELAGNNMPYDKPFSITFVIPAFGMFDGEVSVRIVPPSFSTHSTAMNQRLVVLRVRRVTQLSVFAYKADVDGPVNSYVAPPGYYMMFLVHRGIPSVAIWVRL
ncbi:unnamed protein product [Cochlearia groenlandica]